MYKYDLHTHASGCSLCALRTPAEMARACYEAGLSGMVLTDHFLNGYTAVDRALPWEQKIRRYLQNYEEARAEGEKWGIDVLFGYEYATGGGMEVLTYGVTGEFLLQNPDLCDIPLADYARRVHGAGGYLSQAHPFRRRPYIDGSVKPCPQVLDGAEVINGGNDPAWDQEALAFARLHKLGFTAGSDAHDLPAVGRAGILSPRRLRTGAGLVELLRHGSYEVFRR